KGKNKTTVALKKDGETWLLTTPDDGPAEIGTLLTDLVNLKVEKDTDYVADGVTDIKKIKGLPEALKETLRITVTRSGGEGEGKKAGTSSSSLVIGLAKKDKDNYFAFVGDNKQKDVVRVSAARVAPILNILKDPSTLRNKNLVLLDGFKQPDAIDI